MTPLEIGTPERWRVVKAIVAEVLEGSPDDRAAMLDRRCGADAALRREVEMLLAAARDPDGFLATKQVTERSVAPTGQSDDEHDAALRAALESGLAGRYTIERELGRGGMAAVFVARDARNARRVAIKVLEPDLAVALGTERFLAEVWVTASLTHPNILPLFDSGDAGGLLYYVAPYIEGASLRARLQQEPQLPLDDAIRIAREVADALDYAHRHGFVHRDVKPENILLADGHAVMADFGIARAIGRAARGGEASLTATGIRLGTPAYMSPEQTAGDRELDGRSDVYALGCVLYEMLAGVPPFAGPTPESVLRQHVVTPAPAVAQLRPEVPPAVARAVARAMAKTPADRFGTAAEFAAALRLPGHAEPALASAEGTASVRVGALDAPRRRMALLAAASIAGGIAVGLLGRGIVGHRQAEAAAPALLEVPFPADLTPISSFGNSVALSPDGSLIAYLAAGPGAPTSIYVRSLYDPVPRRVPGTEGAVCLSFSPDGGWILFSVLVGDRPFSSGRLAKVAVDGREPITLADSATVGGIWTDRGEVLFAQPGKLLRISSDGGPVSVVARKESASGIQDVTPAGTLPGGKAVLVWLVPVMKSMAQLAVVTLPEARITRLPPRAHLGGGPVRYANGQLLYQEGATLVARPFSLRTLRFTGPATTVVPSTIDFDISGNGVLVWLSQRRRLSLVAVTDAGVMRTLAGSIGTAGTPVGPALLDTSGYVSPRLSPDGKRVALDLATDIWVYELESRTLSRVTTGSSGMRPTAWTPDGREVLFIAVDSQNFEGPTRLVARPWDGGPGRELMRLPPWEGGVPPSGWTGRLATVRTVSVGPPHTYALFAVGDFFQGMEIWLAPLDTPRAARALVANGPLDISPALSPNGKWMAYVGAQTGRLEVYVRRVLGRESREQVSEGGGIEPAWSRDGRNLFYRSRGWVWRARIDTGASPVVARRDSVFADVFARQVSATDYDIFPGGRELLMVREQKDTIRMGFVTNWPALLERRSSPH